MTTSSLSWAAARRLAAGPLYRLREFLGGLARGLREQLAAAVGDSVAAVLRALLEVPEAYGHVPPPTRTDHDWQTPSWRDEDEDPWQHEPEEYAPVVTEEIPHPAPGRWRPTLAAALQVAAWWLRRPAGGLPAGAALAAGVSAGLAALAGLPLSASAALAGSALGLLALADAARDGVDALTSATTP